MSTSKIEFLARTIDYEVQVEHNHDDLERFKKILEPYVLTSLEESILIGTFYENKTQAEMAVEFRLPNAVSVNRMLKHTLEKLRQRGFKL